MNNNFILILLLIIIIITIHKHYFIAEPFECESIKTNIPGFSKTYNNFITGEECDYLINIAKDKFVDSTLIFDLKSSYSDKKVRSSENYFFSPNANPVIYKIEKKISFLLDVPMENIEPIQMVKYEKNQEYLPHYDYIKDDPNQRTHTFIIYLNSLEEKNGGSTHFVNYNKKIYPKKAMGICFKNIDSYGRLNSMSLHGGEKIIGNVHKYILTIWVRKNKFVNN